MEVKVNVELDVVLAWLTAVSLKASCLTDCCWGGSQSKCAGMAKKGREENDDVADI